MSINYQRCIGISITSFLNILALRAPAEPEEKQDMDSNDNLPLTAISTRLMPYLQPDEQLQLKPSPVAKSRNEKAPLISNSVQEVIKGSGVVLFLIVAIPTIWPTYLAYKSIEKHLVTKPRELKEQARAAENALIYEAVPLTRERGAIRLVQILPGGGSEQIRVQMLQGSWRNSNYDALSYVWGDSTLSCEIAAGEHTFHVSQNLHDALYQLRCLNGKRTIWIDAMCIHQGSFDERNSQVVQMKDVYEHARKVIIWLGHEPAKIDSPFQHMAILKGCDYNVNLNEYLQHRKARPLIEYSQKLLGQPWWTRMWVIQELICARDVDVQYGTHALDWDTFCTLVDSLISFTEKSGTSLQRVAGYYTELKNLRNKRKERTQQQQGTYFEYGLLSLAYAFRFKKATDPRDKLQALLGLVDEEALIAPDYAMKPHYVFMSFAREWINRYGSLLIIAMSESVDGRYSWYFDWSSPSHKEKVPKPFWIGNLEPELGQASRDKPFSAAGGLLAVNCTVKYLSTLIRTRGFRHDTIRATGDEWSEKMKGGKEDKLVEKWKRLALASGSTLYPDLEQAFLAVISGGVYPFHAIDSNTREAACIYRRFFVTSWGYFGLGPRYTQAGDICTVLLGCDVPLILRNQPSLVDFDSRYNEPFTWEREKEYSNKGLLYSNVGQAYVHGIMNYEGDLHLDVVEGKLDLEDFYLISSHWGT